MSLRRSTVAVGLAAACLPAAAFGLGRAHRDSSVVPLATGGIVRVNGTTLGCEAKLIGGVRELDCRKYDPLVGTYGAVLTMKGLRVVRYDTRRTGTVVFSAEHSTRKAHECG